MIAPKYSDDLPVNAKELAEAMRVSRWTVYRWRSEGYRFEFGSRTTAGHLKDWLRSRADLPKNSELEPELAKLV